MRAAVIGAGPAGLYSSYLLKRAFPEATVEVVEQNPADATWGFGVVFSDQALEFLREDDPETHAHITPHMVMWRDLTLDLCGERIRIDGIGFAAIGRLPLLRLLQDRVRSVGIEPRFDTRLEDLSPYESWDLVVGADGLNSIVRASAPDAFGTTLSHLQNRFVWYGTTKPFDTLTQSFRDSRWGPFNAHHYRYQDGMSTFIVETRPEVWARAGFAEMDEAETRAVCEGIFADVLDGHGLVSNNSYWRNFPKLWNERWWYGNRVLLGDALHTAHFSIGSGTRLALEDAIALVEALKENSGDIPAALQAYQDGRKPIVEKLVAAANASADWYERFDEHMNRPPWEFAYSYIRRAGRVDDERLRKLAPEFMAGYEAAKRKEAG